MFRTKHIGYFEQLYISDGIRMDFRLDGRKRLDYRDVMFEMNVLDTCSGSAHVRCGNTDVLVGIKLELEEVTHESPWTGKGRVEVCGNISGLASPEYEGRGGEEITMQVQQLFQDVISRSLDLEKLVVVPEKSYFVAYIDFTILEHCSIGTLVDITSIAIKAALVDTRIPKLDIISQEHNEFVVNDSGYEFQTFDTSGVPLFISFMKFEDLFLVDPTMEEEVCEGITFCFAYKHENEFLALKKFGSITKDTQECPTTMPKLYAAAEELGKKLWTEFEARVHARKDDEIAKITFSLT